MNDQPPNLLRIAELIKLRRFDDALAESQRGVANQPDNAGMWSLHGQALSNLGRRDEAITAFERVLSLAPQVGSHHAMLGRELSLRGWYSQAMPVLERSIEVDPNNNHSHAVYVEAILRDLRSNIPLVRRGPLAKARSLRDRMLTLAPEAALTHVIDAKVALADKDHAHAEDASRRALAIDPSMHVAHQMYGLALEGQGRTDSANEAYLAAGRLEPRSTNTPRLMIPAVRLRVLLAVMVVMYVILRQLAASAELSGWIVNLAPAIAVIAGFITYVDLRARWHRRRI